MTTLDSILVRFDPDSDWREANWVVCDADGAVGSERRDVLETIVAECAGRPIIGLLPGAAVLATRAALPRASRNKRLQALPYALEDQLAADPETLHFALGRERGDGSCEVEIVARELVESVLARCRSADLTLAALHADAACIAPKPGDLQVWIDGDDMHVRHPDGRRQTLPAADLLAAVRLTGIETQTDGVLGVRVYGDGLEAPAALTTLDVAGGVKYSPLDTGALAWLGRQRTLAAPVDLLQGEFARPSGWSAVDWTRWRTTAAAAVALALISLGVGADDFRRSRALERELDAALLDAGRTLLPQGTDPADAASLLRGRVRSLPPATTGTIGLPAAAAALATATPSRGNPNGAATDALRISKLETEGAGVRVTLDAANLAAIETLKKSLGSSTWRVDFGPTRQNGERIAVDARLSKAERRP